MNNGNIIETTTWEKTAFQQEQTRNLALDYFYTLDNVPLSFLYKDNIDTGETTPLEARNMELARYLMIGACHEFGAYDVGLSYLMKHDKGGSFMQVIQLPLQVPFEGNPDSYQPATVERPKAYLETQEVKARFREWWRSGEGARVFEKRRTGPPSGSFRTIVENPDRTIRVASITAIGNVLIIELICTWTTDGVLRESPVSMIQVYSDDGKVLSDREYLDHSNWPSEDDWLAGIAEISKTNPETVGVLDYYFDIHRSLRSSVIHSEIESRNLDLVKTQWLAAQNDNENIEIFHPDRFRMQWPIQKRSFNIEVSREIDTLSRECVPEREIRIGTSHAKGNQVFVECIASWKTEGRTIETPFMSHLLLDSDGRLIRERRYLLLNCWPGHTSVSSRLGL